MNLSSADRCLRHIFLNSIIIKQVRSSDTEWLCSGWPCQKAVAESGGLAELFAGGEWHTDRAQPVCCRGGRRESAAADTCGHTSTSTRISHLPFSALEIQPPGIRVQTRIYFLLPLFGAVFVFCFFFFNICKFYHLNSILYPVEI